jgi:hypothetical protein
MMSATVEPFPLRSRVGSRITDFPSPTHKIFESGENTATVNWIAKDTISATGRKVTNDVDATLAFKGSPVIDLRDSFRYCLLTWTPGRLDAWTPGRRSSSRKSGRPPGRTSTSSAQRQADPSRLNLHCHVLNRDYWLDRDR